MNNQSYFSNKTIFGFYAIYFNITHYYRSHLLMPSIECEYCQGDGVLEQTKSGYYGPGISPYIDIYEVECFYCEGSGSVEGELEDDE